MVPVSSPVNTVNFASYISFSFIPTVTGGMFVTVWFHTLPYYLTSTRYYGIFVEIIIICWWFSRWRQLNMVAVSIQWTWSVFWALTSEPFVRFWFWRQFLNRQWNFPQLFYLKVLLYLLSLFHKMVHIGERTLPLYLSGLFWYGGWINSILSTYFPFNVVKQID